MTIKDPYVDLLTYDDLKVTFPIKNHNKLATLEGILLIFIKKKQSRLGRSEILREDFGLNLGKLLSGYF